MLRVFLSFVLVVVSLVVHGFGQGTIFLYEKVKPGSEIGNWRASFPQLAPDDPRAEYLDKDLDSWREYFANRAQIFLTHYDSWVGYCKGKGIGPSSSSFEATVAQRDSWIKEHKDWENCVFYFAHVGFEEPTFYFSPYKNYFGRPEVKLDFVVKEHPNSVILSLIDGVPREIWGAIETIFMKNLDQLSYEAKAKMADIITEERSKRKKEREKEKEREQDQDTEKVDEVEKARRKKQIY